MTPTSPDPRTVLVALHEAGHAVARASFGLAPGSMSIVEGVTRDGIEYDGVHSALQPLRRIFYDLHDIPRLTARQRRRVEQEIVIGLAGTVAVERVFQRKTSEPDEGFEERQIAMFLDLLALDAHEKAARLELLRRQAQQIIEEHWLAVEAVTGALITRGELSGREARTVIETAASTD